MNEDNTQNSGGGARSGSGGGGSGGASSLGEYLRHERENRGITIEQVASATKISVRLLHSLEADQFAELPAKPFIRGFVTSYARFIDLDAQEILTRFDTFIDLKMKDRPMRGAGHSGYAFEKRDGEQSRTVLWIVMGTFLVLGGLMLFIFKPSLKHHKQSHLDQLQAAHVSPSPSPDVAPSGVSIVALPSPAPSGVVLAVASTLPSPAISAAVVAAVPSPVSPSPTPSAVALRPDPLNSGKDLTSAEVKTKVLVKALADVWVRYQCDEKPVTKFLLRKDGALVLKAKQSVKFQASNAQSINFKLNSHSMKLMSGEKNLLTKRNTATLVFPSELSGKIKEFFPGERALPTTSGPESKPSVTPSPNPE